MKRLGNNDKQNRKEIATQGHIGPVKKKPKFMTGKNSGTLGISGVIDATNSSTELQRGPIPTKFTLYGPLDPKACAASQAGFDCLSDKTAGMCIHNLEQILRGSGKFSKDWLESEQHTMAYRYGFKQPRDPGVCIWSLAND
jgi:hypothetical protein